MALKLKKNDTVLVIAGKDRGKKGKIERVVPSVSRVVVSGANLVKKHAKKRNETDQGGRIEYPAPMSIAKVMLICASCSQPARVGFRLEAGSKVRFCKNCGKVIGEKRG